MHRALPMVRARCSAAAVTACRCEARGLGPVGVSGVSMGGHVRAVGPTRVFTEFQMASLVGGCWPEPLAVVPCMSSTNSALVYVGAAPIAPSLLRHPQTGRCLQWWTGRRSSARDRRCVRGSGPV